VPFVRHAEVTKRARPQRAFRRATGSKWLAYASRFSTSQASSAASASLREPNGPSVGPPTDDRSASHWTTGIRFHMRGPADGESAELAQRNPLAEISVATFGAKG
jgi:hypothetical protein